MISVIIPIYNTEASLARCIDSVLDSTYKDFEIILVNDGSTDNGPDLCREYCRKDKRIRLIDQENQGVSVARNTGIGASRGEWVVFVDSDDYISRDFLKMVAEEEPADLLIFDFMKPGQAVDWETICKITIPLDSAQDRAVLLERLLCSRQLIKGGHTDLRSASGKAYRKTILDRYSLRFTPRVRTNEDILFNAECYLNIRNCRYIPIPVYCYTVRMGSTSHSFISGLFFSVFQRKMKDILTDHQMFPRLEKAYAAKTLENIAYTLIKGIFNPHSKNTAHENRDLCRKMREDEIYAAALKFNYRIGNLPRRIILGFFQLRCYCIVKVLCRICFFCIEQIDKAQETQ